MDATSILIDSDAELFRARALINQLWNSNIAAEIARLEAQDPAGSRVRGKEMAPSATERRRFHSPPDGSARADAS